MMANTVTSSSPCLRRPACVPPRSVLRRRALQCRHSRGTRSCAVTYRANAGSVDHPEHHAQARPKWNERYELIVRLDAIAKEKESSLPVESSTRVFGTKVHRDPVPVSPLISLSSDGTRSCAQTVMSGGINLWSVDFVAFLLDFDRVRRCLIRLFLVRNWCGYS